MEIVVDLEIIEYEDQYQDDLKKLTYEWINKYFYIESEDEKFLSNPKELVIDRGGFIFLAKMHDEIIGTVTLMKVGPDTFELAKLAVTEKYQGLHVGKRLLDKCLHVAGYHNAKKIVLDTNRKLTAAVAMYKKYGFQEISLEHNKYVEVDLRMKLILGH